MNPECIVLACLPVSLMPDLAQKEPASEYVVTQCEFCSTPLWLSRQGRKLKAGERVLMCCPACARSMTAQAAA